MEKTRDCLTLPDPDQIPFPDKWVVDVKTGITTLDKAESARVYYLLVWTNQQIAQCKDSKPAPAPSPTSSPSS